MDSLKVWLIEVGLKKMGPSLIRAAIAGGLGLIAAHANVLANFGIVYDKVAGTITLHLDTLDVWLMTVGLGTITALLTAAQHHTVAAVTGTPQSGDVRKEPDVPVEGGKRETDIPKGA